MINNLGPISEFFAKACYCAEHCHCQVHFQNDTAASKSPVTISATGTQTPLPIQRPALPTEEEQVAVMDWALEQLLQDHDPGPNGYIDRLHNMLTTHSEATNVDLVDLPSPPPEEESESEVEKKQCIKKDDYLLLSPPEGYRDDGPEDDLHHRRSMTHNQFCPEDEAMTRCSSVSPQQGTVFLCFQSDQRWAF